MSAEALLASTLGATHDITPRQLSQLAALLELLEADEHAPTAVRAAERAAQVHVADSLAALELEGIGGARRVADLGAGAGFPGLALAVVLPEAQVSLIESQRRKCEFLDRALLAAGLENVQVVCGRAEEWQEGLGGNDVVVARALGPQAVVLEYAAPLLRLGGRLIDWRGKRLAQEEQASAIAAEELGLRLLEIRRVEPFPDAKDRHLHVYLKERDTPRRFPRRPGMARKRPLGA